MPKNLPIDNMTQSTISEAEAVPLINRDEPSTDLPGIFRGRGAGKVWGPLFDWSATPSRSDLALIRRAVIDDWQIPLELHPVVVGFVRRGLYTDHDRLARSAAETLAILESRAR